MYSLVSSGVITRNVWLWTVTSAMVVSIFGMWHATQSLPALAAAWWVCSWIVAVWGPFGVPGPWHSRHIVVAGFSNCDSFSVPCTSWQLGALDCVCVHYALNKIVALHPILVCRAIAKVGKRRLA